MRKTIPVLLTLILISSLMLAACGGDDDDSGLKKVTIAVSVPLALGVGQNVVDALELGLEQRDGKVGDVEVSLLVLNSSDPDGSPVSTDVEATIAKQAADDKSVVAYIGPMTTDQARTSIPILNKANIAQITESATWPGLTKAGFGPGEPGIYYPTGRRTFFRTLPADDTQAVSGAQWINELGFKSVVVVSDGTGYGDGISGIFEVAAQDFGLGIVSREILTGDDVTAEEIASAVDAIVKAEPDIVYFGGGTVPAGVLFITALREALPDMPVMGTDGLFQEELITEVGAELVEGIYVTNPTIPVEELAWAREFVEAYQQQYQIKPLPYVLGAYAAMESVLTAIEQTDNVTREGVLEALSGLETVNGVFGTWSFDANGDTTLLAVSGWQIENGEWSFVQIID